MSQIEVALAALIGFHQQIGVTIEPSLLPPLVESEIQAVESKIGFRLPNDLRELYKIANGQLNPYDDKFELNKVLKPDDVWAPLFGNYQFLPIDEALDEYESQLEMYEANLVFNKQYTDANEDSELADFIITWDVREGDPVHPSGWNPQWFPFATTFVDSYSIDMTPAPGGTMGQVVEHGADVAILSVVARSVTELMEQAVLKLDPKNANRFQRSEADEDYRATVYFDMDWRNKPYNEQEHVKSIPPEYQAWIDEQSKQREINQKELKLWLFEQGLTQQDASDLISWSSMRLNYLDQPIPPAHVLQLLNGLHTESNLAEETLTTDDEKYDRWVSYYSALSSSILHSKGSHSTISSTVGQGMETIEAIDWLHRYYHQTGVWTTNEFNAAEEMRKNINALKLENGNSFQSYFGMTTVNADALRICHSNLDVETYKSEDFCTDIKIILP